MRGDATIMVWQILTTLKLLASRWSFGRRFCNEKNEQKCLSHARSGLDFLSRLVKMSRKMSSEKKMGNSTYTWNACTHKGWAIILRRAFFPLPHHNIQNSRIKETKESWLWTLSCLHSAFFSCSHFVGIFFFYSKQNVQFHTNKHHSLGSLWMCSKKLVFILSLSLGNRLCAMLFHHNIYDARTLNKECDGYGGKNGKMTACFRCLAFGHTHLYVCHASGVKRKLYLVLVMKKTFIQSMCTATGDYSDAACEMAARQSCSSKVV